MYSKPLTVEIGSEYHSKSFYALCYNSYATAVAEVVKTLDYQRKGNLLSVDYRIIAKRLKGLISIAPLSESFLID